MARGHFITIDYPPSLSPASVLSLLLGVFYVSGSLLRTLVLTYNAGDNNTLIICVLSKHCASPPSSAWCLVAGEALWPE